jgi:hypothetical protein
VSRRSQINKGVIAGNDALGAVVLTTVWPIPPFIAQPICVLYVSVASFTEILWFLRLFRWPQRSQRQTFVIAVLTPGTRYLQAPPGAYLLGLCLVLYTRALRFAFDEVTFWCICFSYIVSISEGVNGDSRWPVAAKRQKCALPL